MDWSEQPVEVDPQWRRLDLSGLRGVVLVVGATDVGKSFFARYLFNHLLDTGEGPVAFLDGDPGQSVLGPPATLTITTRPGSSASVPPGDHTRRYFIGANTPRGHMLGMLVGYARLISAIQAPTVVVDTSGLVDQQVGGGALKQAKIDLLQPSAVFAIQAEKELESWLLPVRRSRRTRVIDLRPAGPARSRSQDARRSHRLQGYRRHFSAAGSHEVTWTRWPIFPLPRFRYNRLLAFEDADGFTLALGIVTAIERSTRRISVLTPLDSLDCVNAMRLGDLLIDPRTFQDQSV